MPERADGYYWLRLQGEKRWQVGEWRNELWEIVGWEGPVYEDEVTEVGPRLEPPPDA